MGRRSPEEDGFGSDYKEGYKEGRITQAKVLDLITKAANDGVDAALGIREGVSALVSLEGVDDSEKAVELDDRSGATEVD